MLLNPLNVQAAELVGWEGDQNHPAFAQLIEDITAVLSELSRKTTDHEPRAKTVEVFISYSHKDDRLRKRLETHLSLLKRQGDIDAWHDRRITAGREWEGAIDEHLDGAALILLLVSADFLASDYCYDREMTQALARHDAGEALVIPIILRPVDWRDAPFAHLQALPKDGKAVTEWSSRDRAFRDIAEGIRKAVAEIQAHP